MPLISVLVAAMTWASSISALADNTEASLNALLAESKQASPPTSLVIFGATGDLTSRKLIPDLFALHQKGELPTDLQLIAASHRIDSKKFLPRLREGVKKLAGIDTSSPAWAKFERLITVQRADFDNPSSLDSLRSRLGSARKHLFYLAIPPKVFPKAIEALIDRGMLGGSSSARLIIEKPFGRSLAEARSIDRLLDGRVDKKNVLLMDHYLGKQAIVDLLKLRFIDKRLEPAWSRRYIKKVIIRASEAIDIQNRASFYDQTGALRDFVQGHLMQLLSVVTMDKPKGNKLRAAKAAALRALRPLDPSKVVRGQYQGYTSADGVDKDSKTETYVALRTYLESSRWRGVPFVLATGKALDKKQSRIDIYFKRFPAKIARALGVNGGRPAKLSIVIDPTPRVLLRSGNTTKEVKPRSAKHSPRSPYERLLLAAISGERGLFAGSHEVYLSWKHLDPVQQHWQTSSDPVVKYERGSVGPCNLARLLSDQLDASSAQRANKPNSVKATAGQYRIKRGKRIGHTQRKARLTRMMAK